MHFGLQNIKLQLIISVLNVDLVSRHDQLQSFSYCVPHFLPKMDVSSLTPPELGKTVYLGFFSFICISTCQRVIQRREGLAEKPIALLGSAVPSRTRKRVAYTGEGV